MPWDNLAEEAPHQKHLQAEEEKPNWHAEEGCKQTLAPDVYLLQLQPYRLCQEEKHGSLGANLRLITCERKVLQYAVNNVNKELLSEPTVISETQPCASAV